MIVALTSLPSDIKENPLAAISYGPIYLYYGSQTGTAAGFCKVLAIEALKNHFQPIVVDLKLFDPETFVLQKVALFCMANQGKGEPTDNAVTFYNWLTSSDRPPNTLNQVRFSVFGLGNKTHDNFNAVGRKTNAFLEKLGAERIYPYGEGDDDDDIEADFEKWKSQLWSALKQKVAPLNASQPEYKEKNKYPETAEDQPPFEVILMDDDTKEVDFNDPGLGKRDKEYDFQAKGYLDSKQIKIVKAYELRQNNQEGSTIQIEFNLRGSGMEYVTAANLYVFPENDPELVDAVAHKIGISLSKIFMLKDHQLNSMQYKHPVPSPISVKTYLTQFCDLQGPIKKNTLRLLAQYVENSSKKRKLLELVSVKGQELYENEILKPMKGLFDIIFEYDVMLTLRELIYNAENIKPRSFTIASSALKSPENIQICTSLTRMQVNGSWRFGLMSGYLKRAVEHFNKNPDAILNTRAFTKASIFDPPTDSKQPIIMVGTGAGIAPFRAFLQEKEFLIEQGINKTYGDITLYFGCRRSDSDYIYKDELEQYRLKGIINQLYVAFSREKSQKYYVQDLIKKHKEEVCTILFEQHGLLYLCGSVRMGLDVIKTLGEIGAEYFGIPEAEGVAKIKELEQGRRIMKEIWE